MDIDDIDLEDPIEDSEPVEEQNSEDSYSPPENQNADDIITSLLKDRGIDDTNKIKFEDENGLITEKSWNQLSVDEKKNILNQSPTADPDVDLDSQEIEMLNQMRLAGMNPEQYVTALRKQGADYAIAQNKNSNDESNLKTADLTDDELYVLDLQYRSPDMTDEEIAQSLNIAKQNTGLFEKQVEGLRQYYANLESEEMSRKELEEQQQREAQFQEYANYIQQSINNLNNVGSMDISLSNDDKNELAQFILGRDQAGINWFGKALEDPDTVTRMAWFALKGEDAFNEIESYIAQQIKTTAQNYYNKGLQDGKNGVINNPSSKVVVTSPQQNPNGFINRKNEPIGLEDIDF